MKHLLKVTAMTGLLTLLKMAMGFVIAKVVAVYTGPTGMAMLGQVQSLVASLNGIVTAPVGSGLVKHTTQYSHNGYAKCAPWWRASVQLSLLLFFITAFVLFILSKEIANYIFNTDEYKWFVMVVILSAPFGIVSVSVTSITNGLQQYSRYFLIGLLSITISSLIMLMMVRLDGMRGALYAVPIQVIIMGFVLFLLSIGQPWLRIRYWFGRAGRKHKLAVWSCFLMVLVGALSTPLSLIFVRKFLFSEVGLVSAGHWQAVWKVSEVYLSVITMAIGTYYLPRLSAMKNRADMYNEVHKTAAIIVPVLIFLSVSVYILRDIIITVLYTEEFRNARELFSIQLIGDVIKVLSWLYAYPMFVRGETKLVVTTEIAFSVSFVLLAKFFIVFYGVQGANLAYLINYIFYFSFIFIISIRKNEKTS